MPNTETQAEALIWLASLERACLHIFSVREGIRPVSECQLCDGTGKVPVLDLRDDIHEVGPSCLFGCLGYSPKQGRDALFAAMEKDGWWYDVHQHGSKRTVAFYRPGQGRHPRAGEDADDWVAAVKAMRQTGY